MDEVCSMRFVMVAIWSVLIGAVVSYVLTSMANEPFNLTTSFILSGIFAVIAILLGEVGLREQPES